MNRTILATAAVIGLFPLSGCASSVDEVKAEKQILALTTKKPVDAVAGCIGEKWLLKDAAFKVSSVKTEKGWIITSREGAWTFGVVEVVPENGLTAVKYSSGFQRMAEMSHIPAIQSCV